MTPDLPPLPATDWLLHMPAAPYEPAWTSSQSGWDEEAMRAYAAEAVRVARLQALEDAARLCDARAADHDESAQLEQDPRFAVYAKHERRCAAAIRALKPA